jgi:hypothetical protein
MYTDELSEELIKKSERRWGNISREFTKELKETADQIRKIYLHDLPPENEPAFVLKLHVKLSHKSDFIE